jgi:hypothetical protein
MLGQDALLVDALGCYELHIRPRGGFADGRSIGRIILPSLLHEQFDRFECN